MNYQTSTPNPPDANWVSYTQAGNQKMQENEPELACYFYEQAFSIAEERIATNPTQWENPDLIHLYIIAGNNLADSYVAFGRTDDAETKLLASYHRAIAIMKDHQLPWSIREEAYNGFQQVFRHLINFYQQTDQQESLAAITEQSKQESQCFMEELMSPSRPNF